MKTSLLPHKTIHAGYIPGGIIISAVILMAFITSFYFSITSNDKVVGFLSDDAIYLLLAEIYSPWTIGSAPVLEHIRTENYFPPLYPLLMGLMGVSSKTPELASIITTSFLVAAFFIYGIWVWQETRNEYMALVLPLIIALLPSSLLLSQELWSEFLFMFFLYGTFAFVAVKDKTFHHWLAATLLVGLASITRSVGIALIITFIFLLVLERPKKYIYLAIISAIPFVCWLFLKNIFFGNPDYFDIASDFSYFQLNTHIFDVFLYKLISIKDSWIWLFSVFIHPASLILSFMLFLFFLPGFYSRLKEKKIDAVFTCIYLSIILLWPYSDIHFVSRFLYPLLPLIIFYFSIGAKQITDLENIQKYLYAFMLSLLIILAYPGTKQFISRAYMDMGHELNPYRRNRFWMLATTKEEAVKILISKKQLIEALPLVKKYVPLDGCIYALQTPFVMLYTERISNVFPPIINGEFSHPVHGCDFYLGMPVTDIKKSYPPYYPAEHTINNDNFETVPFLSTEYPEDNPVYFLIKRIIN